MPKITLIKLDDWQGIYIDNEIVAQGHSFSIDQFVGIIDKYIEMDFSSRWVTQYQDEVIQERGFLPETLEELDELG